MQSSAIKPLKVKDQWEKMEEMWAKYKQVQTAIEVKEGVNLEAQHKYRATFEDLNYRDGRESNYAKKYYFE